MPYRVYTRSGRHWIDFRGPNGIRHRFAGLPTKKASDEFGRAWKNWLLWPWLEPGQLQNLSARCPCCRLTALSNSVASAWLRGKKP